MRRFYIILSVLFLSACTKNHYPSLDEEPVICMNARFNTADTLHKVYISRSYVNTVTRLPGQVVQLHVGDGPADTAHVRQDGAAWFHRTIETGETVKVSTDGASASASGQPVPRAELLDEVCSLNEEKGKVTVRIHKRSGNTNFYLLQILTKVVAIRDNDGAILQNTETACRQHHDIFPLQKYPELFVIDEDNFTDRDCYEITTEFTTGLLPMHSMSNTYEKIVDGQLVRELASYTAISSLSVRVSALTHDDYWMLRYANLGFGDQGNLGVTSAYIPLVTLPTIYPENVSGGIGLVTVRTTKTLPVAAWELHYDIDNYHNPEATPIPVSF